MKQQIEINVKTQERALYNYRYKKNFNEVDIDVEVQRNPYANFLTFGLAEEAIGKGWEITVKGSNEIHPLDTLLQEKMDRIINDIVHAIGLRRAYGHTLVTLLTDEMNEPQVRGFKPADYQIETNSFGTVMSAEAREEVKGWDNPITYTWTGTQIENVKHVLYKLGRQRNKGESLLAPIWDDIVSLSLLNEHTSVFVIRNGAGRLVVSMPEDKLRDTEFMAKFKEALGQSNSLNTILFLPFNDKEMIPKVDNVAEGQGFEVLNLRDLYLQTVSMYSGIPMVRLKGIEPGQLEGAEKNELRYFDVLQTIQQENMDVILWITKRVLKQYAGYDGEVGIRYKVREELTDQGRLDSTIKKMDMLMKIMADSERLQISLEEAKKLLEIDYKEEAISNGRQYRGEPTIGQPAEQQPTSGQSTSGSENATATGQ